MSIFGGGLTQYATIDEAWGSTSSFSPSIENTYKVPGTQSSVLAASESVTKEPDDAVCARYVNKMYKAEGLVGVRRILDPVIIRELQTQAIRKYAASSSATTTMLGPDELLFVMLALLAVVFAVDSS